MKHFVKSTNKRILLLQIQILMLLIAPNNFSQWTQTSGPEGGNFYHILIVGDELLALSSYDLYVSTNKGVSWNWRSTPPKGGGNVFLDGSDIFLVGIGGVTFSSDNGMTWTLKNNGLDSFFSPISMTRFGDLLFVGGAYSNVDYGALFKSSDNGESWQKVNVPFVQNDVIINSFCTIDSILIGLGQKAIYRSTDKGSNWQMVLNSAPNHSSANPIISIDSFLILGGDYSIFRSSDYGANWQVVADTTGASSFIQYNGAILASTGNKNQAILQSTDLGKSWHPLPFYSDSDISIANLFKSSAYLFGMHRFSGLFRSNDGGITWENISKDFPHPHEFKSIIIKDSLMLISNLDSGILRSSNYGTTWKEANSGLTNMPIYYLYAEDNLLLASTAYPSSSSGKLFRSADNGNTWETTSSEIQNIKRCFLRFQDKIYAGTVWGGIVSSTDDGTSWTTNGITGGFVNSLVEANDSIYAGISSIGIYTTADQGETWSPANNGLPNPLSVEKIIVVPESLVHGKIIFLATGQGVYYSTDYGNNWLPGNIGFNYQNIWTIAATKTSANSGVNLFAASKNYYFVSNDLGENWVTSTTGPNYESSLKLYSYPENPGLDSVLFALADSKIIMTSDHGQNWKSLGDNIERTHFYDIDIDSNYLYAGTSRGVWKRPLSEIISNLSPNNKIPTHFVLEQNYPNPFNPTTTIRYTIPHQSFVTIKIFDILGREIESLFQEENQPGTYEITWNAAIRPSGIYFYKINAGDYTEVKKMILIK